VEFLGGRKTPRRGGLAGWTNWGGETIDFWCRGHVKRVIVSSFAGGNPTEKGKTGVKICGVLCWGRQSAGP